MVSVKEIEFGRSEIFRERNAIGGERRREGETLEDWKQSPSYANMAQCYA
jgi:hypothetical protein